MPIVTPVMLYGYEPFDAYIPLGMSSLSFVKCNNHKQFEV